MNPKFSTRPIPDGSSCRWKLWWLATAGTLLLVFVVTCPPVLRSESSRPNEYQVKAVYLYNFSRFVEWPTDPAMEKRSSFSICILGRDPFGAVLDTTIAGESIGGKTVVARRISKAQESLDCRVLFLSTSEDSRLKEDLAALEKTAVLTVSDIPHFSERGGMIQFVSDGTKIRFEVNLSNAVDSGLSLSSDLLKVAIAVRKNSQAGD